MEKLNEKLGFNSSPFEFYWGMPQESLVIFKQDDVLAVRHLTPNTIDAALAEAQRFILDHGLSKTYSGGKQQSA